MRHTVSVIICTCASLALCAILTRYFHPHWAPALFYSLHLHLAIACVMATVFALIIRQIIGGWLVLAVAIALTGHGFYMSRQFAVPERGEALSGSRLRLMSFNTLNSNIAGGADLTKMILSSGADVVNLLESQPLATRVDELSTIYPYRIGCMVVMARCDQMLLSKTPIEDIEIRTLSDVYAQRYLKGRIAIDGQSVTIVGIHTTKPYFDGFHADELYWAAHFINRIQGPVIVAGDFNASTLDVNIQQFLTKTGLGSIGWEPSTWPISAGPFGIAIDHVYVRAPLGITSLERIPQSYGSNHYGLVAEVALPPP